MQPKGTLLLDDGEYYVEHNPNCEPDRGNGFLMRRCEVSTTAPGGEECVGSYVLWADGKWHADVNTPYDEDTDSDCRSVGMFDNRLDAIGTLWQKRHEAYCRHSR
jgi:hypothetical protein